MPIGEVSGPGSYPGCHWVRYPLSVLHGVCSSVGRASDCDSEGPWVRPPSYTQIVHNGQGLGV
jgi:hypothetical protein